MAKKLRCYLWMHRWERKRDPEGVNYYECRDCGTLKEPHEGPMVG